MSWAYRRRSSAAQYSRACCNARRHSSVNETRFFCATTYDEIRDGARAQHSHALPFTPLFPRHGFSSATRQTALTPVVGAFSRASLDLSDRHTRHCLPFLSRRGPLHPLYRHTTPLPRVTPLARLRHTTVARFAHHTRATVASTDRLGGLGYTALT